MLFSEAGNLHIAGLVLLLLSISSFANAATEECLLSRGADDRRDLGDLVDRAIDQGCYSIRIPAGKWELSRTIAIRDRSEPLWIHGDSAQAAPELQLKTYPGISLLKVANLTLEHLVIEGGIQIDQTENITIRGVVFRGSGIRMPGRRCNQPNECSSFNRQMRLEDNTFEDCERGILAERLEYSTIQNNRFTADRTSSCERRSIGIELDGSTEDIDRKLEQGHSKGNQILHNSFEQEGATGIRIRESLGNVIRENQFHRSFRAIEFLDETRLNQVISNYVSYLSQMPTTSACPNPCGIYVGPGTFNNLFLENFFEQSFEIQFLERNRNQNFVIDESGGRNVFRSDYLHLVQ